MHRYLDHELDEMDEQHLTRHLLECSDCAALFERLKRVSNELENLPKVRPAYSLVDAIMPRLEQYDRDGALPEAHRQDSASLSAREQAASRRSRNERVRQLIQRWPYKAIGGVVAAGLIVGLIITTYEPKTIHDAGEHYERQMSNDTASPDRAAAQDSIMMDMEGDAETLAESGLVEVNTVSPQIQTEAPAASPEIPLDRAAESESGQAPSPKSSDTPRSIALPPSDQGNSLPDRMGESDEQAEPEAPPIVEPAEPVQENDEYDDSVNMMNVPEESEDSDEIPEPPFQASGGVEEGNLEHEYNYGSPDGTMNAMIEREQLVIYTSDEPPKLVFESAVLRGSIVHVEWSSDSKQVTYEMANEGVITRYKVDVESRREWMEAMRPEDTTNEPNEPFDLVDPADPLHSEATPDDHSFDP